MGLTGRSRRSTRQEKQRAGWRIACWLVSCGGELDDEEDAKASDGTGRKVRSSTVKRERAEVRRGGRYHLAPFRFSDSFSFSIYILSPGRPTQAQTQANHQILRQSLELQEPQEPRDPLRPRDLLPRQTGQREGSQAEKGSPCKGKGEDGKANVEEGRGD
jgi:hypothetical protein